jgi:hypothetical protein
LKAHLKLVATLEQAGLIPQNVFTMLVIMAVVTTLMAGPLLKRLLLSTGHVMPAGMEA